MSRFSRRELLGGAALAGAAALGCGQKKDPYRIDKPPVPRVPGWRTGEERWVLSTCALCEAGCGIKVRVVEGRAVKIEGNPEHPVNRGGLCSRGQAALQALYHPERVRSPLRRTGSRGGGQWKTISWDEAIGEVTAKLAKLRAAGHPERLVLIDGETGTFTHDLWARFLSAYGSPNHVGMESARAAGVELATLYTQGRYGLPAYDLAADALGAGHGHGCARVVWPGHASPVRAEGAARPRVICVSPRRPGCRSRRVDPDCARRLRCAGAVAGPCAGSRRPGRQELLATASSDLRRGGTRQVSSSRASRRCFGRLCAGQDARSDGHSAATVERLAHALAEQRPAVVASDGGATAASNGLATAMAIAALNALLGNVSARRSSALGARSAEWEAPTVDALAAAGSAAPRIDGAGTAACPLGRSRVQAVPAAITWPNPIRSRRCFCTARIPWPRCQGRQAWVAALQQVPFVVSFSRWLDETAWLADLVLPESLFLEAWTWSGRHRLRMRPCSAFASQWLRPCTTRGSRAMSFSRWPPGWADRSARSLPWKSYADAVAKSVPAAVSG